jgi:hypothetical protein
MYFSYLGDWMVSLSLSLSLSLVHKYCIGDVKWWINMEDVECSTMDRRTGMYTMGSSRQNRKKNVVKSTGIIERNLE